MSSPPPPPQMFAPLLRPQALKKNRAGSLAEYGAMYRQLGKIDAFRKEYCKARAAAAHKRWFASATSATASGGSGGGRGVGGITGSGLAMWLPSFLEYLQVGWGFVGLVVYTYSRTIYIFYMFIRVCLQITN